jgi:hypothetical protein
MALTEEFLDALALAVDRTPGPLDLVWPAAGNPAGLHRFEHFTAWREFVQGMNLRRTVPLIVSAKFDRAQKLYALAWLEYDLIKAGELVALATLELALKDRYGLQVKDKRGNMAFRRLLRHMVEHDGLTDEKIPMVVRSGGTAINMVNGKQKPSLSDIRNTLAHGDPFDGFPYAGLLELVRDLIDYAYRDFAK